MLVRKHDPGTRGIDLIVEEKLSVLEDFYIVDDNNRDEIKRDLICAIREQPTTNPDSVADRFAKALIARKL